MRSTFDKGKSNDTVTIKGYRHESEVTWALMPIPSGICPPMAVRSNILQTGFPWITSTNALISSDGLMIAWPPFPGGSFMLQAEAEPSLAPFSLESVVRPPSDVDVGVRSVSNASRRVQLQNMPKVLLAMIPD